MLMVEVIKTLQRILTSLPNPTFYFLSKLFWQFLGNKRISPSKRLLNLILFLMDCNYLIFSMDAV